MGLALEISHLAKSDNGVPILRDCSFAFAPGRTSVLQGPNGSGKSTLFRVLARLEQPDQGRLHYLDKGRVLAEDPSLRRRITLVLPQTGVFSTAVFQNVAYGLKIRGMKKARIRARVEEVLEAVGLAPKKFHRAREPSSGETKRLGLARALALDPEVLLLDEPTANIDPANGKIIEDIILRLRGGQQTAIWLATHDPAQAERLGDDLLFRQDGRLPVP